MKFKYSGTGGNFYGTEVLPGETYEFHGEQKRLALKSLDFKKDTKAEDAKAFMPKKKKTKGDK